MPLFSVLAVVALLSFRAAGIDTAAVIVEMNRLATAPMLIAIPLFTFAGYLFAEAGSPRRLVRFSRALLGWVPGGLAIVALVACAVFTAFTGASGVTIIAMGGILMPALLAERYEERFTLGLLTTTGSLGLLFPPSLPVILYAYVAQVSVDKLFLAGLVPGLILILMLGVYSARAARRAAPALHRRRGAHRGARRRLGAAAAARRPRRHPRDGDHHRGGGAHRLLRPGGRGVHLSRHHPPPAAAHHEESMVLVGILIILRPPSVTNYLDRCRGAVQDLRLDAEVRAVEARLLADAESFLLVVGCLMDIFSALIVVVPLIVPIAQGYGVDLLHLGIIFLVNLEIGYSTPPVGLNLFIASFRFRRPVTELYHASLPFLALFTAGYGAVGLASLRS
jgi:TRAP-type C4-dicarboxylate transport system permease large subunit